MEIIKDLQEYQKAQLAKGHLLEALRRMSEYFVEKYKPIAKDVD